MNKLVLVPNSEMLLVNFREAEKAGLKLTASGFEVILAVENPTLEAIAKFREDLYGMQKCEVKRYHKILFFGDTDNAQTLTAYVPMHVHIDVVSEKVAQVLEQIGDERLAVYVYEYGYRSCCIFSFQPTDMSEDEWKAQLKKVARAFGELEFELTLMSCEAL